MKKILLALISLLIIANVIIWHYPVKTAHNKGIVIECDYSLPNGFPRLFVFKDGKLLKRGVCLHGCGKGNTAFKPKFSNEIGSGCSSLGKYKVIGKGTMSNGYRCLKLRGLSKTNSNAERRGIMIHHSKMVDYLGLLHLPYMPLTKSSEGCFSVSSECYDYIEKLYNENKTITIYAKDK